MNPPAKLPEAFGQLYGHRRLWREHTSQELSLRVNHRRRKVSVRAGVLVAFAFAMVVYPVFGTLSPTSTAVEYVPGVVLGESPETVQVVLGEAPALVGAGLPLPQIEDTSRAIALTNPFQPSAYLPSCSGSGEWSGTNGQLSEDSLCTLWDGRLMLRSDAAVALAELNHRFRLKFGRNLCLASAYRTLGAQVTVKRDRGYLAAPVGLSPHGWGIAIDLCYTDYRGEYGEWWKANAGAFGWIHPHWAETSLWEPWHWEYGYEHANGSASSTDANIDAPPEEETEVPDVVVDPSPSPTSAPDPSPSP